MEEALSVYIKLGERNTELGELVVVCASARCREHAQQHVTTVCPGSGRTEAPAGKGSVPWALDLGCARPRFLGLTSLSTSMTVERMHTASLCTKARI